MMAKNEILSLSMRNIKKGSALKSKATHAIHPVPVNAMKMSSGPRKFLCSYWEIPSILAVGLLHKAKGSILWERKASVSWRKALAFRRKSSAAKKRTSEAGTEAAGINKIMKLLTGINKKHMSIRKWVFKRTSMKNKEVSAHRNRS